MQFSEIVQFLLKDLYSYARLISAAKQLISQHIWKFCGPWKTVLPRDHCCPVAACGSRKEYFLSNMWSRL